MIYHLFRYLDSIGVDFPGMGLMNYLSFRAMLAAVTAVLVSMFAGKRIIARLQRLQIGETVRDLGLEGQIQKKGTPTMGGIIIIVSILSGVLLFCDYFVDGFCRDCVARSFSTYCVGVGDGRRVLRRLTR